MIRKKSNILFIAIILISLYSRAQFHYTALLDTVKATGFYHITITPELSSYLKTDLSDLRIVDEKNQPVGFITDIPYSRIAYDEVLFGQKIIKKETIDSKSILVIENSGQNELSNFIIKLRSAAAQRTASLSGSDDNVNWFAILDSLLLQKSNATNNASHFQRIEFPPAGYKYFKLTIVNDKKAPLSILSITSSGIISAIDSNQFFFFNPAPSFSQTDSGRFSVVKIIQDRPFHISTFKLGIADAWLYKREARLFTVMKPGLQQTWNSHHHAAITLSSDNLSGYAIPFLKSGILYILIDNGDNPPLKIASVTTSQIKRNIIAQLEKGKSYSLLLDNLQATAPDYDLQHFRDRIPDNTAINIKTIHALRQPGTIVAKKSLDKWWIWPAIIITALFLGILAWKTTADLKKLNEKT